MRLTEKRIEVIEKIKPICSAFEINDYDYIIDGNREYLKLDDTLICCDWNSISAIIDELIGYLFVKRFCKSRSIGAFRTQAINAVTVHWKK